MLKSLFTNNTLTYKYQSLINQINSLETNLKTLTDSELRAKTFYLKKKYQTESDKKNRFY